jgi:hypothetical protein
VSVHDDERAEFLQREPAPVRWTAEAYFSTYADLEAFVSECGADPTSRVDIVDVLERLETLKVIAREFSRWRRHATACIRHERTPKSYVSYWSPSFELLCSLPVEYIVRAIELYPTAVSNWHTVEATTNIYRYRVPFEYASAVPWDQAYQTPRGYTPAEMAVLYRAGVPAQYASAVAASGASADAIVKMYQSNLPAEYAIEVFG